MAHARAAAGTSFHYVYLLCVGSIALRVHQPQPWSQPKPELRPLLQVESADGCHLDRQTLSTVRAAGFASVDAEVIDLRGFWVLSPTAAGIALR